MMTAPDGTILLFYSGNDLTTSRYAEGVPGGQRSLRILPIRFSGSAPTIG
jgi:hypothetical protein